MVINVSDAIAAYKQSETDLISEGNKKKKGETDGTDSFGAVLQSFATDTIQSIKHGESMAIAGVAGKANLQEVILATNQATLALDTATTIRDRVISAYKEIMQMPV